MVGKKVVEEAAEAWMAAIADVLAAIQDGGLRIFLEGIFALERAADMHAHLESRQVSGKLLLSVGGGA